jgi:hypothetical protein
MRACIAVTVARGARLRAVRRHACGRTSVQRTGDLVERPIRGSTSCVACVHHRHLCVAMRQQVRYVHLLHVRVELPRLVLSRQVRQHLYGT